MKKWFEDLKISKKIIYGFLVLAIVSAIVGITGVIFIERINNSGIVLYKENTLGLEYLGSAYADFNELMDLAEGIIKQAAIDACGTTTITYEGTEIDLSNFRRVTMNDIVLETTGKDFSKAQTLEEAKDIEIEFMGHKFKPFDLSNESFGKRTLGRKTIKLEPIHTLKTQFAGYSIPEELESDVQYFFNTVLKTSHNCRYGSMWRPFNNLIKL